MHSAFAALITFRGKPAHAAAAPHEGRSALTACLDTFRLIDGQRVHFRDGVRVHGFVTNGGQAVGSWGRYRRIQEARTRAWARGRGRAAAIALGYSAARSLGD